MCIIDGEIDHVVGTKLFVMPSEDRLRQLTVYSNKVNTKGSNVMCLPVPNPSTVTFETVYTELFGDCHLSSSNYINFSDDDEEPRVKYLSIHSHGSYEVVLAPTLDDLERVPHGFMTLSDDVKSYLRTHYSEQDVPFGVLLCKLRVGAVVYEPFAYSHAMLPSGKLFVPTRHYHIDGSGSGADNEIADDWDHAIYSLLTPAHVAHTPVTPPANVNCLNWSKMPAAYRYGSLFPMRLFERVGRGPNEDLTFPLTTA